MKHEFMVSVIVPIYNGEKRIKQCIESLMHQTYQNIEIILVDDGSTDRSRSICEIFSEKYKNIIYIYKDNHGVSSARNLGIKNAKGKYLMFSDCDDYYENDAIENMINASKHETIDLVIGGIKKHFINHIEEVYCCSGIYEQEKLKDIISQMQENFMLNQMWGKLFKTDIIMKHQLFLLENMSIGEDLEWMCRYMSHAESVSSIQVVVYNYIIGQEESLSTKFYTNYFDQIDNAYSSLVKLYKSKNMWESQKTILINKQLENYWSGLCAINSAKCSLCFLEKVEYIKKGNEAQYYREYLMSVHCNINPVKKYIMKMRHVIIKIILIQIVGELKNDYIKNKK